MVIMSPTPSSSGTQYVNGHNVPYPVFPYSSGTQYVNGHNVPLPPRLAVHNM